MMYSKEQIEITKEKIRQLINIVDELEAIFPKNHFTLDGVLVSSIGQIIATYIYGIRFSETKGVNSYGKTDGGQHVQVRTTQNNQVLVKEKCEYYIVLWVHFLNIENK